jgi:hypothetical protein
MSQHRVAFAPVPTKHGTRYINPALIEVLDTSNDEKFTILTLVSGVQVEVRLPIEEVARILRVDVQGEDWLR